MDRTKRSIISSVLSVALAAVASSHHWLHMAVLFFLGGSAHMMGTMSYMIWLRRLMIAVTLITVLFAIYRLIKHRCANKIMLVFQCVSIAISLGFITYTLIAFGW